MSRSSALFHLRVMITGGSGLVREIEQGVMCPKLTRLACGCMADLIFFELPERCENLGVGASRCWMLKLAKKICSKTFPFAWFMDDNVQAWKLPHLRDDHCIFEQYQLDLEDDNRKNKRKDIPLSRVMEYWQRNEFLTELEKFGMIGFHCGYAPSNHQAMHLPTMLPFVITGIRSTIMHTRTASSNHIPASMSTRP